MKEEENEWRHECSLQEVPGKKRVKEGGVCERGRTTRGAWCSKKPSGGAMDAGRRRRSEMKEGQ